MVGARRPGITLATPLASPPGRLARAFTVNSAGRQHMGKTVRRNGRLFTPRQSAPSSPYRMGG
ncbi:MAG: hypothetical protein R3C62_13475 [Chloroflexota bacterium]